MKRPRLLDLCCKAGGAAMGYHRAGFDVVGVDIEPQPRYPFEFCQGDALELLGCLIRGGHFNAGGPGLDAESGHYYLSDFDAIHASPPCQAYSISSNNGAVKDSPRLIDAFRKRFYSIDVPWVIENVPGAPMFFTIELCGASFGLGASGFDLPRHRLFESSVFMLAPACTHRRGKTIGVYGNGTNSYHRAKLGRCLRDQEKRLAMGIDWMTRRELSQAIPPAYTHWIGRQLIRVVEKQTYRKGGE